MFFSKAARSRSLSSSPPDRTPISASTPPSAMTSVPVIALERLSTKAFCVLGSKLLLFRLRVYSRAALATVFTSPSGLYSISALVRLAGVLVKGTMIDPNPHSLPKFKLLRREVTARVRALSSCPGALQSLRCSEFNHLGRRLGRMVEL